MMPRVTGAVYIEGRFTSHDRDAVSYYLVCRHRVYTAAVMKTNDWHVLLFKHLVIME